jgi:hypothetical protein
MTNKRPVASNLWKRMSGVFEAFALHETGEVSSAEPLVGSNGLLTLSALEKAKKTTSDHHPRTCHRRYRVPMLKRIARGACACAK